MKISMFVCDAVTFLWQYPALSPAGSKSIDYFLVYTKHIRNESNLVVSLVNMQISVYSVRVKI